MVTLTIDGQTVSVPEGTTILEAARPAGIAYPHPVLSEGHQRDRRLPHLHGGGGGAMHGWCPPATTRCSEGMVVHTNSPQCPRGPASQSASCCSASMNCKCANCTRSGNCKLQQLANDYNLLERPLSATSCQNMRRPDYSFPLFATIENRCVKCMRCIQVCDKMQGMNIWDLIGHRYSHHRRRGPGDRTLSESDCTFCGQCITHCPVGGLQERDDTGKVLRRAGRPGPDHRGAGGTRGAGGLGGVFRSDPGAGHGGAHGRRRCSQLGFDYVFDTNFAADLTIMEEGSEFIERFTHRSSYHWPMFTSCCPGWVRFLKGQYPGMIRTTCPPPRAPSRCSAPWPRATLPRSSAWTPRRSVCGVHHALRGQEGGVRRCPP